MEIYGTTPNLRTTIFQRWNAVGLRIHEVDPPPASAKAIGDVTDPNIGFNQFIDGVSGPAVIYERDQVLLCENIYWGTEDPAEIEQLIQGSADFEPFLAASALVPSGLTCTVLDGLNNLRVPDAVVTLIPSSFPPLTENEDGVYGFPVIRDGQYQISVLPPSGNVETVSVGVSPGQVASVVVVVNLPDAPPQQCGCQGGAKGLPRTGDAVVMAATLASFMFMRRSLRRPG
jgi:hypothetical protein